MFTPDEILALNHSAHGPDGLMKREVLLRDQYQIGLRQWQRICAGKFEISRTLAHVLLDRFDRQFPNCALAPCIVQTLPDGDWLIRVRRQDAPRIARLLRTPPSDRLAA